jgi:hypothetical protein
MRCLPPGGHAGHAGRSIFDLNVDLWRTGISGIHSLAWGVVVCSYPGNWRTTAGGRVAGEDPADHQVCTLKARSRAPVPDGPSGSVPQTNSPRGRAARACNQSFVERLHEGAQCGLTPCISTSPADRTQSADHTALKFWFPAVNVERVAGIRAWNEGLS